MRRLTLILILLAAAGCAAPPRPAAVLPPPVAATGPTHDVVSAEVAIRVHPDGPLAGLGHSHLIRSDALGGTITLGEPLGTTSFALELPLASLVVDPPGSPATVNDDQRAATRRNMLGPALLDAERFPLLDIRADGIEGGPQQFLARVRVGIRGEHQPIRVPLTVTVAGGLLTATGRFALTHRELGLEPYSVALGALRVAESIDIEFRLAARRRSGA